MTRAEEAAIKAYPIETRDNDGIVNDIGHPQWIRDYFIEGYEQAEKDIIRKIRGEIVRLIKVNIKYENEGYRFGLLDLNAFLDILKEE